MREREGWPSDVRSWQNVAGLFHPGRGCGGGEGVEWGDVEGEGERRGVDVHWMKKKVDCASGGE